MHLIQSIARKGGGLCAVVVCYVTTLSTLNSHFHTTTMVRGLSLSTGTDKQPPISVAVIGGGIAGLSCAQYLQECAKTKFEVTVFDTGRLRPGGRCASRLPGDLPKEATLSRSTILGSQIVDHAAQILAVSPNASQPFKDEVNRWVQDGVLSSFPVNSVFQITSDNDNGVSFESLNKDDDSQMYYGSNGMGSIPFSISRDRLNVKQDVWISPSNGVKYIDSNSGSTSSWRVKANGNFDRLVIAHNGKCADRLMSRTPAKKLHSLLRTNFAANVAENGGKRMTLNSLYSLSFAVSKQSSSILREKIPHDFISGFIKNEPKLRFISNNTQKYQNKNAKNDVDIYTVLSSPSFAKKYKAPQENLPNDLVEEVTNLLLEATERAIGVNKGTLSGASSILETRLQLWGAAVPLNTWDGSGFIYDDKFNVGVCGDWLLDPSIEGAWESGYRLAKWMDESFDMSKEKRTVGLPPGGGSFVKAQSSKEAGIGSFPSLSKR